jgi:septum site-determining protein MinC
LASSAEDVGLMKGACELKSAQFSLMRLAIYQTDANAIQSFVADQVSAAPALLEGAPVALDFSSCAAAVDAELVEDLLSRLRYAGVQPIALVTEPDAPLARVAQLLKLGVLAPLKRNGKPEHDKFAGDKSERDRPLPSASPQLDSIVATETAKASAPVVNKPIESVFPASPRESVPAVIPAPAPAAKAAAIEVPTAIQHYEGQVRSGQQLYAKGRDLIVTGAVGASSEVIADGSVHIYGRLMGKVIAGASGNRSARIYCLAFGAELISIAGIFRVFEAVPADLRGKAVQIWLDGDKLRFDTLN